MRDPLIIDPSDSSEANHIPPELRKLLNLFPEGSNRQHVTEILKLAATVWPPNLHDEAYKDFVAGANNMRVKTLCYICRKIADSEGIRDLSVQQYNSIYAYLFVLQKTAVDLAVCPELEESKKQDILIPARTELEYLATKMENKSSGLLTEDALSESFKISGKTKQTVITTSVGDSLVDLLDCFFNADQYNSFDPSYSPNFSVQLAEVTGRLITDVVRDSIQSLHQAAQIAHDGCNSLSSLCHHDNGSGSADCAGLVASGAATVGEAIKTAYYRFDAERREALEEATAIANKAEPYLDSLFVTLSAARCLAATAEGCAAPDAPDGTWSYPRIKAGSMTFGGLVMTALALHFGVSPASPFAWASLGSCLGALSAGRMYSGKFKDHAELQKMPIEFGQLLLLMEQVESESGSDYRALENLMRQLQKIQNLRLSLGPSGFKAWLFRVFTGVKPGEAISDPVQKVYAVCSTRGGTIFPQLREAENTLVESGAPKTNSMRR